MKTLNRKKVIRRLFIFVAAINLIGWFAWMMASSGDTPEARDLGNMIWLVSPLLVSLLLRLFGKDWKDMGLKFKVFGNLRWYLFSLLFFPILIAFVAAAGSAVGALDLSGINSSTLLSAMAAAAGFTFVKNIFEEFSWRGYLTPKFDALGIKPIRAHLLTGLIWAAWHLPYYLGLLDPEILASSTALPIPLFITLTLASITLAGILFGALRQITGSTWPAVLMHTVSNVILTTLVTGGYIGVSTNLALVFSPGWEGLLMMACITLAGFWLMRKQPAQS